MRNAFSIFVLTTLFVVLGGVESCAKPENDFPDLSTEDAVLVPDTTVIFFPPQADPQQPEIDLDGKLTVTPYAEMNYRHQSAAVYGDYAFLVLEGRSAIRMFDMVRKTRVYTLSLTGGDRSVYHSNQCTFGVERYEPSDTFPLLYISQRVKSGKRCFTEVFRIVPLYNADSTALLAFRTELVQEIFFPPMSEANSMGNVNCVIDGTTGWMYTYSRNNNSGDRNYQQCKISRFAIPDIHQKEVFLEDSDIESSFLIDTKASNMQGGCIMNGKLYIGQGYPNANYVYLNVVDLREERLVKRYDLLAKGVDWEPEGCFQYDGNVMLSYTSGISRIIEEEE